MRNRHAGAPFADGDEQIEAYLADLSVPALLASCVHLLPPERHDEILDGPVRPQGIYINELQGFMSPEDQAAGRKLALEIIRDYRDRGCPEPEPPSDELARRIMEFLAVEEVTPDYLAMMLDELGLDGRDHRRPERLPAAADYPAVIVGAGMSGLLAAIRLGQAGFPYVVLEKNDDVGGTWWENTYPGARVDVASHFYSYSFDDGGHWSEFFSRQPELRAYFAHVADSYGLRDHIRFGVEVTGATWNEDDATWTVEVEGGDPITARVLVTAVGQLNRPLVPEFPGSFDGPAFHTSRWRDDVDLTGKRVVMIGAGATGFQLAPAIAERVEHLTIIQRTAQWMFPNPGYHEGVGPGVDWATRHLPFYGRWFRFVEMWPMTDKGLVAAKVDPAWEPQRQSVSEINDMVRVMFGDWIREQVGDDAELLAKVLPTYPPTGKRTLQDNGTWLKTLQRDNVELVRAGVERLAAGGVVDSEGVEHPADVVVFATGFRYNDLLLPLRIRGRDGVDLREMWGIRPAAHVGVTVAGFPNLFLLYGPGTNAAGGSSAILGVEFAAWFMTECLRELVTGRHRTVEVTREAYDAYYARFQDEMRQMVWASPHIEHNYFTNEAGEVHGVNPFRMVDYWHWTRRPDPADYVYS